MTESNLTLEAGACAMHTALQNRASSVCREKVGEVEAETYKQLEQDGAHVIPVEDKTPWIEACQPTIQANSAKLADLYQQIVDLAK